MMTNYGVSHDWSEETIEAKARWFQSLTISERLDMLCFFTDLALAANPSLQEGRYVEPVQGRIQVLSREDLISSKRAAGRDVDLEDVRVLELSDKPDDAK